MPDVDLSNFGFGPSVPLDGTVIAQPHEAPALFLFSESHENKDCIAENLVNACRLIDAGVIDLVAVEEWFPNGVIAEVTKRVQGFKSPTIAHYSASLLEDLGGDRGVIDAAKRLHGRMSFASTLLYLRPTVNVVCVEDGTLQKEAEELHEKIKNEHDPEPDPNIRQKKKAAKFRHAGVNRAREYQCLLNTYRAYRVNGATRGVILNLGGYHQEHIARILDNHYLPYVRVIPLSYTDFLAGFKYP